MGRNMIWNMHLALVYLVMVSTAGCTFDLSLSRMNSSHLTGPTLQYGPGDFPIGKTDFNLKEVSYYLPTVGGRFILSDSMDPQCALRTVEANFEEVSCFDGRALRGLATDASGNIFAGDSTTNEVKKFDKDGNLLLSFGGPGAGNGLFNSPADVALDSGGNIYVVDQFNQRVQKFDAAGNFILAFGSAGAADGQFSHPNSVAINPDGDILIADGLNSRIQKFSPLGVYISKFGSGAPIDGSMQFPNSLAVDSTTGDVYVADFFQNKILKYDSAGVFLWATGNGLLLFGSEVALINGEVVTPDSDRIVYFSQAGAFLREKKPQAAQSFQYLGPIALNSDYHFYIGDGTQVKELDYQGQVVRSFGAFAYIGGIALDDDGNIFVTDTMAGTLLKFSPVGVLLGTYSSPGAGATELQMPLGVLVHDDVVYVCDTANMRIQKFSTTGVHLGSFGDAVGPGYIEKPAAITWGSDDHFYIVGLEAPVFKYDVTGTFIASFGTYQVDNSVTDFTAPMGIFAEQDGEILVTDKDEHRITKFDTTGNYLATIGSYGGLPGRLHSPSGIVGDELGNFYVTDVGNHRIQKFNSLGIVQEE